MKEINLLQTEDIKRLHAFLEDSCSLLLPFEKERFGELSFHLYRYNDDSEAGSSSLNIAFQIRWGANAIFHKKNLKLGADDSIVEKICQIIHKESESIKKAIFKYCENQLSAIVPMSVEPVLIMRQPNFSGYKLQFCKGRGKKSSLSEYGWPNYCVLIAWYDELGDFQEFISPIGFDAKKRKFLIDAENIVLEFQKYRDTVI